MDVAAMERSKIPKEERALVKLYLTQLNDNDPKIRIAAIVQLSILGRDQKKKIVPAITKCLEDDSLEVRKWAALILSDFGENPKNTISILIDILRKEKNDDMRSMAATTLGEIRVRTTETIPALKRALKDNHWRVREQAALSLKKIETELKSKF